MVDPQSANISLNGVAVLNCTAVAVRIRWKVNGEPADDWRTRGIDNRSPTVDLNETQELRKATLTVKGSHETNNVSVVCIAFLTSSTTTPVAKSKPALILVQGNYKLQLPV